MLITLPIGGSTVPTDVLTKLDGTTPLIDWTHKVLINFLDLIPDGDDTECSFFSLITVVDDYPMSQIVIGQRKASDP